ncbi:MAG: NAD-dependent epimerase/dehydratase family protein [Candidatus Obscuribacterales bacterium]|nr:NAD-dependent epimerase/dehydratase family protein [Candidatus Obscuribacterales bacterium]
MSLPKSNDIITGPRKVLITGATGFVGANLARYLVESGHQVSALLRPGYKAKLADNSNGHDLLQIKERIQSWNSEVDLIEADLLSADSVKETILTIKPDWIFNLAAHGAYSWQSNPLAIVSSNVTALANLLDESSKIGFDAFVNAGSSSEYGFKDHAPLETEEARPNSLYAVTKMAGTNLCGVIARRNNLSISTLRLYSVYGPFEDERRLIPTLIKYGLLGELPPLVNPYIARDFIYIDDVCRAFVKAALAQTKEIGAVYNIGTGVQTTIEGVVQKACKVMSINDTPVWGSMSDRNWDTSIWIANCEKAMKVLQWQASVDFENGLQQTVAWTKKTKERALTF